ncbi:hypothetical protein HGI30_15850 [Paenibacillus albicereus]|uniref:Uncharacterized protein n=1 Tax=Paenibacillus albicereus TaxID=2726185 RepID=A0A6H2GZN2_9BACL|nr:hypothetical protein [Paenibacillus albicereus]QJC52894.1 hypothetical protein HGI30_15850 [Paenibacillus albicereus]
MSQKAGNTLIVIAIILLNLILMTSGGGRSGDFHEVQTEGYVDVENE